MFNEMKIYEFHDAGDMSNIRQNTLKIVFQGIRGTASFEENWYEASESQALYILFK